MKLDGKLAVVTVQPEVSERDCIRFAKEGLQCSWLMYLVLLDRATDTKL
jgi:hypothetical protein